MRENPYLGGACSSGVVHVVTGDGALGGAVCVHRVLGTEGGHCRDGVAHTRRRTVPLGPYTRAETQHHHA
jgi:hypothetical protein